MSSNLSKKNARFCEKKPTENKESLVSDLQFTDILIGSAHFLAKIIKTLRTLWGAVKSQKPHHKKFSSQIWTWAAEGNILFTPRPSLNAVKKPKAENPA